MDVITGSNALPVYSNKFEEVPSGDIPSVVSGLVTVISENPGTFAGTVTVNDVSLFHVTSVAE